MNPGRPWRGMSADTIEKQLRVSAQQAITATWCSTCYQPQGQPCVYREGRPRGNLMHDVHTSRRKAAKYQIAQEIFSLELAKAAIDKRRAQLVNWLAENGDIFTK